MQKSNNLKCFFALGVLAVLILGSVWGYNIGKQESFPPDDLLANPSADEDQMLLKGEAADDQVIVKFKSDVPETKQDQIESATKTKEIEKIDEINTTVLQTPDGQSGQKVAELRQKDEVEYAELNGKVEPTMIPNDSGYGNQWALPKIQAPQGWDTTQGTSDVTIAVLDTGVTATHADLQDKVVPGYNVVDNNTDTTDLQGHGTLMMGIAGATTNNSIGMAGVAINPKIMMIRICNNAEGWAYWSDLADGIIYAADHGVKIVSISFGGTSPSVAVQNAVNYAYSKGVFISASAGNSNSSVQSYPAACDHVVAVAATDSADNKASFSNYGPWVDIASPGVSIYSTNRTGSYSSVSGTSPACPHVAGIGALLLSLNKDLTPLQIENIIEQQADDLGTTGRDDIFGWGRINMRKAVNSISAPPVPVYGTISGRVLNANDSSPLLGATVNALQSGRIVTSARTSADGSYQLLNLSVGTYSVAATINGFEGFTFNNIVVVAGETTQKDFLLKTISAKGAIVGRVFNNNSKPKSKVLVRLRMIETPNKKDRITRTLVTHTDRNSNYSFKGLPQGRYVVMASYWGQYAAKSVYVYGGSTVTVNLTLSRRSINKVLKVFLTKSKW